MDKVDAAIAITANADKNASQISFSPTQVQFSQRVTPDPPPIIIHLTNTDFTMAMNAAVSIYVFFTYDVRFLCRNGNSQMLGQPTGSAN
jgi:hypothetical protein